MGRLGAALHFQVTAQDGCAASSSCCRDSSAPLSISKLPTSNKKASFLLPCHVLHPSQYSAAVTPSANRRYLLSPHLPVWEIELHLHWATKQSSALRESWQSCENWTGRTQLWQTRQELLKSQQKNNCFHGWCLWKLGFLHTNCQWVLMPDFHGAFLPTSWQQYAFLFPKVEICYVASFHSDGQNTHYLHFQASTGSLSGLACDKQGAK